MHSQNTSNPAVNRYTIFSKQKYNLHVPLGNLLIIQFHLRFLMKMYPFNNS